MKPAPFEYSRPQSLDEACALLAADDGARLIAGGQTLVPLMAMRLARPSRLIDIARITGLAYVREEFETVRPRASGDPERHAPSGQPLGSRLRGNERKGETSCIAIGATTKQHVVESDPLVRARLPLLAKVMPFVGHAATRARGTVGGSLANGDPAAEMVLVAATLGATLVWRDSGKSTTVAAQDFFIGAMVTALPLSGCLVEARFPVWHEPEVGVGFHEVNARQSDFAFVSAATQVALDGDGCCTRAAVGIGAATAVPLRLDAVADELKGRRFDEAKTRAALKAALAGIEPLEDLHASAEYRRRVAVTMAMRAIADAFASAARRA